MQNYIIRRVTSVKEFRATAIQAAIKLGVRPALDDSKVIYSTDPRGHFVGELDGKVISCVSAVKYGDQFGFWGYYIVNECYRGKGYGLALFNHVMSQVKTSDKINLGLDAVAEVAHLYENHGFKVAWTNRRLEFDISYCVSQLETFSPPVDVFVRPAKEVNQDLLIRYDTTVFGAPHDAFLKALLNGPNSLNFAATNQNGDVLGFVSARKTIEEEYGWKIGPLFADGTLIAKTLLKHVFREMANEDANRKVVVIDVPYDLNPEADAIAKELNGKFVIDCFRMFTKGIPDFPKQKLFGVATPEIG